MNILWSMIYVLESAVMTIWSTSSLSWERAKTLILLGDRSVATALDVLDITSREFLALIHWRQCGELG